jgi:hypothetical protein
MYLGGVVEGTYCRDAYFLLLVFWSSWGSYISRGEYSANSSSLFILLYHKQHTSSPLFYPAHYFIQPTILSSPLFYPAHYFIQPTILSSPLFYPTHYFIQSDKLPCYLFIFAKVSKFKRKFRVIIWLILSLTVLIFFNKHTSNTGMEDEDPYFY